MQQNLQPVQDQNLYSQYNSDDFQEEDEHENQLQNIQFYGQKDFPIYYDIYQQYQQGGQKINEITEGEDDDDDDEEEEEDEQQDDEDEGEEEEEEDDQNQFHLVGNMQSDIYFRNNDQEEQEVSEEDDDQDFDDENQGRLKIKISKNRSFEDDIENQFQSSDFEAQRNDIKMQNQSEYQQTRINMGSKNNLSVDKLNSLTQVNTSNYDQMKSLISPKSRVSSYQQFSTLKFQKSNSNNNQMRSNTSLGEEGNNQFELEMDQEEDSHLTSFTNNKNPPNIPNKVNKQTKFKKKSNTISSRGSYVSEQEQMQEGNKIMPKNPSQFLQTSQGIQQSQNNISFNIPVTMRNNSKKKSKTAHYQPQHQILYQKFNQDGFQKGVEMNNEYFQGNHQVGSIIFAQQQQQVQFNNCNQYKFNIQNVNIQHPANISQIIENQKILYKNNNQPESMKVSNFNQNDINLQHQIKGIDQIYELRDVNNSIIEKQVPEPPPPAGFQYPKYELQQANNIINFTHKNSFSSSASKINTNPNSLKNLEQNNNNNSKRGSLYNLQSAANNNNQVIDAKSKVKLMHFSSAEVTPQGSQLGNTPHKSIINLNNFTISPRLYGNDQINNTQITQSILFIPQQPQYNGQLKRDQFFLEDQQENLKTYLANKNKEKLKKKQSDDTTSINNHLSNSPKNNNNNSSPFNNSQVQQIIQNQNKKSKKNKQSKSCVKICMSTVLLDNNTNNDDSKNTKQRVYSQQPYLEDPQIKKKWVLSRASKMQIDPRLANQLIEEINLYQHSKEVILEKLIQSILSYQTLKGKLKKKDNNNEVSVVQAAKNRTTQIFRSVSQLFTSTSNSNPSQQEIQQKMMQKMVNNGTQAAVATTLNNRTTTNDNQITCEQEDYTRYEKDYIQENNSYDDEKKAEVKNAQIHHYKDIIQTTMATTTAAGQLSVYNNNSNFHSINNLPNSFISKKPNYLKGTNNDKNNTINTLSSINNLPSASNQALKAISNVSYNNAGNNSTCPNSVNILSDNNIPGAVINGSICSSSNIQLVQQGSQQVSLFSPNQKDKMRAKKNNKNLNQFDMTSNQQQSIILEQEVQKHKKANNPVNFQQVGTDKQASHKKKEIHKLHNINAKMMDLSSVSISIDPINNIVTPKLPNNSKKSLMQSQININKESKSLEYRQNPQTISNYVQAILPTQQSQKIAEYQINQREQSFSFNNQNICPICQHETQLFALNYKCEHKFCMYCIRQYIESKIYNNDVMKIFCPYKNCRFKLRSEHLKPYISQELFDKFKALRKIVFKRMNPNVRYCTRTDCDGYMIGDEEHPKLTCKKCFQEVCFHCCNNWHQGLRCDQAILEEETEDAQKEIGKQTCPMCNSKLNILQQIDGVQYSNKIMCSACNKPFCNLCRRQCGQFHFAPWNICYGCPGQKYSLDEPQCCEKFCIFLWGVMKLMMYIFLSVIGLALYPFIVAIVSLFMPLIIYAYFKGNRLQYSGFKKYLLLFSLFLLGIILYPVWLLITFIPGTCLFFKDMYQEKRLSGNEIDASQVNQ